MLRAIESAALFLVRSKTVDYDAMEVEYRLGPDPRSNRAIDMGPVTLMHRLGDPGVPSMEVNTVVELTPSVAEKLVPSESRKARKSR